MSSQQQQQQPAAAAPASAPPPEQAGLQASRLVITRTKRAMPKCAPENLGFGKVITDHMLKVKWTNTHGWHAPEITPAAPIPLHPFSHVFHYAQECYEGMKAYVDAHGGVRLFRPEKNMERFNKSASRLCLPSVAGDELLECIKKLVEVDKDWIPQQKGYALYIRPVMFSTTPWLGLTQCNEAIVLVLLCPVGPYFKSGFVPIKLLVDNTHIRAWPGGTGDVKFGGNYGPTVKSQVAASKAGCSQALFVYDTDEWVTEAGTMNIFFLIRAADGGGLTLLTPSLEDGVILPGVTRLSIIEIVREWGNAEVIEKMIPMREIAQACDEGRLMEAFGTGTAAVIQPIGSFVYNDKEYTLPESGFLDSSLQIRLTKHLAAVQTGETEWHNWSIKVCEL